VEAAGCVFDGSLGPEQAEEAMLAGHILSGLPKGSEMTNEAHEMSHPSWDEEEPGGALVERRSKNFRKFDRKMDRQLAKLVERWAHTAAPCAMRGAGLRITPTSKPKPK